MSARADEVAGAADLDAGLLLFAPPWYLTWPDGTLEAGELEGVWYPERGPLEAGSARAMRDAVGALCAALRPEAVALVDALGIPDAVLGSAIAAAG
jgi:hypothetical protein